jgi:diadenosine tetraphosphate (Ap4A) HIT family hydrolase
VPGNPDESKVACPFCDRIASGNIIAGNDRAAALLDGYPLNPGHCLVIPRRHVADFFDLSPSEQADIWSLVSELKARLDTERAPAGYNVGINVGAAAGQTVWHAHVHLIPRYAGDVEDPRGGVRWLIPARAPYWRA